MNKIINKALFYKEWINVKWVTLLTIIVLLFYKVYGVISQLNLNKIRIEQQGRFLPDTWFNNGLYVQNSYFFVMVFVVILLAIILFLGEKTSRTQGFVASMPFTRKEIILNKWLIGALSILISFVVTYIFLSLFYFANINGLDTTLNPYSDIIKWFFMDTLQYICIFTFMVLTQAVMGNSVVSGIVGGILLTVPLFITLQVGSLAIKYHVIESASLFLIKVTDWLCIYSYNLTGSINTEPTSSNQMYMILYYTNYKSKLLVLFLLTCLFLYLAYVSYKKRNLEYNLKLIVFKNLKLLFICGIALCSGIIGSTVFATENLNSFWIWFIISTIIGYFISKLLLKVLSLNK